MAELVEKNIVTGTENLRSEQLLKNMEQQKTAAVLTNLLNGRRVGIDQTDHLDLDDISIRSEDSNRELTHRESVDEGDIFNTSESDEDTIEEQAIKLFETKPNKAVTMLIEHKIIQDTPQAIADFLYCNPRLPGKMVGEYLGDGEERNLAVLDAFLDKMNLADTEFDQAMR